MAKIPIKGLRAPSNASRRPLAEGLPLVGNQLTPSEKFTCRDLLALVTEYLEEGLSASERDRFERHLHGCEGCQYYLDQMRQTVKALGRLPAESLTPEARRTLLRAFREWKRR